MFTFDEATLRKAAAWQDFKEAQMLHSSGAVTDAEQTKDGWAGSVKIGKRTYRVKVIARTKTWLDATCPCPANSRGGAFCPHAIAIALEIIKPLPAKTPPTPPSEAPSPPENKNSRFAWKIKFHQSWEKSIARGALIVSIDHADSLPDASDDRISAWLMEKGVHLSSSQQLSLRNTDLETFLSAAIDHTQATAPSGPINISDGAHLKVKASAPANGLIQFQAQKSNQLTRFNRLLWLIEGNTIKRLNSNDFNLSILTELNKTETATFEETRFFKNFDKLTQAFNFQDSEWLRNVRFLETKPQFSLEITGSENALKATLSTSYSQSLHTLNQGTVLTRSKIAENDARQKILAYLNPSERDHFQSINADTIQKFLTEAVGQLEKAGWKIEISPALQKLKSSFIQVLAAIEFLPSDGDHIRFKYLFKSNDGRTLDAKKIRAIKASGQKGAERITLSPLITNLIDPFIEDAHLERNKEIYTTEGARAEIIQSITAKLNGSNVKESSEKPTLKPPQSFTASFRPYQLSGFRWLIDRLENFGGALLADDMGLGKTIQTIACIEHFFSSYSQSGPALIIVPTTLLGNWKREFEKFAPKRDIITLHGSVRDRQRAHITDHSVILTSYGTLSRDLAFHLKQKYSVSVIDEASLIRNPNTDDAKAVSKLNADYRIALTGTPIENSVSDLWSIFRFIQPGWFGTKKHFKEKYELPLQLDESRAATSSLLKLKTSPFILRRTKLEVAPELPSKTVIDEFCSLSTKQLEIYRKLQREGIDLAQQCRDSGQMAAARMRSLTTLLRLRQTCCDLALIDPKEFLTESITSRSGKLNRLLEIINQAINSNSRILLFSQFRSELDLISKLLKEKQISSLQLDGQTRNRQALVDQFQAEDGPSVFLISLKAGGYGLNLTAADIVIHFDPWWNPAAEAQATDRAHRIGQKKPVTVYRLLTEGTVEEKVVRMQQKKKAIAESIEEDSEVSETPGWSEKELEQLLRD